MSINLIKELRERTGAGMMDCKKALEVSNNNIQKAIEWLRTNGIAKAAKKSGRIATEGAIFLVKNNKKAIMIEINSETDFVATNNMFIKESNKIANAILDSNVSKNENVLSLKINNNETVESLLINMTATIGEKISFRRFVVVNGVTGVYKHSNSKIGVIVSGEGISEEILKDVAMHVAAMNPDFLTIDEINEDVINYETNIARKELSSTLSKKPKEVQENIIRGKVQKTLSENVLLEQTFVKDSSKKVKDLAGSGKFTSFVRYEVGEGMEKKEENFVDEVVKQLKNKE